MLSNLIFLFYLFDVIPSNVQLFRRAGDTQDILWVARDIFEQLMVDESDYTEMCQHYTTDMCIWYHSDLLSSHQAYLIHS